MGVAADFGAAFFAVLLFDIVSFFFDLSQNLALVGEQFLHSLNRGLQRLILVLKAFPLQSGEAS